MLFRSDDWKTQIKEDLDENLTGQALADLIHKEQKILAKEVRWLQDKAWERKEHRNKTQNTLLKRISLLKAALTETAPLQPKDKIKGATSKSLFPMHPHPHRSTCNNFSIWMSFSSKPWLPFFLSARSNKHSGRVPVPSTLPVDSRQL